MSDRIQKAIETLCDQTNEYVRIKIKYVVKRSLGTEKTHNIFDGFSCSNTHCDLDEKGQCRIVNEYSA